MSTWVNKSKWIGDSHALTSRKEGYSQVGFQGNHFSPTAYKCQRGKFGDAPRMPNGAYQPTADVPNLAIWGPLYSLGSDYFPAARNRAFSKLANSVRSGSASLGVALAEWPEALGMVTKRSLQAYQAYRRLRQGNFRGFLRELQAGPYRRHKNLVRSSVSQASGLWLEYSFGWKPLFQDIHSGLTALGRPLPGGKCSGSGHQTYHSVTGGTERWTLDGDAFVKQGADVYVSNPNLYALQQVGLANPALVAWELVPFSFVVDWVFDVGTCLSGLTDLLGCSVSNPYNTAFVRGTGVGIWFWSGPPAIQFTNKGTFSGMNRRLGLSYPLPNFSLRANIGSSLNRAANAASLLGQILTK